MHHKNKLKDAAHDLRFLLNRAYPKKNALNFVSNRYLLSKNERNYLSRAIFSDEVIKERSSKIISTEEMENELLVVDGYNVLITMETICRGDYGSLIWCDDGIIRDLNAVFGKYKFNEHTENALNYILSLIAPYNPLMVEFFYDKQVSFSGRLGKLTAELMEFHRIYGEAVLRENVDFEIIKLARTRNAVVLTSDGPIIDKVSKIMDLPSYTLKRGHYNMERNL